MYDFYIRNDEPTLAELTKRYDALFSVMSVVDTVDKQLTVQRENRVSGGQRPDALKDMAKWFDRERKFEAVRMQLIRAVNQLKPLVQPLRDECQRLRALTEDRARSIDSRGEFEANILTAEALGDDAADYMFRYQWGCYASSTADLYSGSKPDAKEWIIMDSAYGSPFHFSPESQGKVPPPPYMTFAEAHELALDREYHGECVGLYCQLYNVRTGKRVRPKFPK